MNKKPDIYRSCASVVVLRPTDVCSPDGCGMVYQILLLKKPRKKDAWQFPQGGVEEGETVEQAAVRELKEEADVDVVISGKSDLVYQYDFPASYRRFRPDHVCGQRVHFLFATAPGDVQVTVDADEIESYVWVVPEQLPLYVKRPEYLKLVTKLVEEAEGVITGEGERG